jgi:hypothetical protein
MEGRAIAKADSSWLPTAAARIQDRVRLSGICGGQSATEISVLRVLRYPNPLPDAQSSSSGTHTIGHPVATLPSGLSLTAR